MTEQRRHNEKREDVDTDVEADSGLASTSTKDDADINAEEAAAKNVLRGAEQSETRSQDRASLDLLTVADAQHDQRVVQADERENARARAAMDRRHADAAFVSSNEVILGQIFAALAEVSKGLGVLQEAVIANAATGRPPVNQGGD